ncbi:BTAD domain-containing putative transcriptional regulator [Nocardiopsis chromatogenes]|uniref:BTAD domain-containing putative transcriptional regulator n=1 Tax=Nocardiopsis chromatogenes TaxID=280239 RepID=UPI00034D4F01|nr:OmpA family protein [Nocardiopsis chromatogenes]
MRLIRDTCAAAAGAAFFLGAPALLLHIGWPLQGSGLTWPVLFMYLRGLTLPVPVVMAGLVAAAWAAWGAFTAVLVGDLVRVVRGAAPRLALLRLVAALLAASGTATGLAAPALAAPAEPAVDNGQAAGEQNSAQHATGDEDPSGGGEGPVEAAAPVERTRAVAGFALDSAELDGPMRRSLEDAAELIAAMGAEQVHITGHTDPTGPHQHNQELSQRRAQAAADHLNGLLGEDFQVTAKGMADEQDRADGSRDHADLRRIEITYTLLPPEKPGAEAAPPAPASDHQLAPASQTAPEEEHGAGVVPVGAAAAVAGAAAGFALGRRTTRNQADNGRSTSQQAQNPEEPGADAGREDEDASTSPAQPEAKTPGTGQSQNTLDFGDGVKVDASQGVTVTGTCAPSIVARLLDEVRSDASASVVATRAALTRLGHAEGAEPPGVRVAATVQAALVRAEAHMLAAHREGSAPGRVLVILDDPAGAADRLKNALPAPGPGAPLVVALQEGLGSGAHLHADEHGTRLVDAEGGEHRLETAPVYAAPPPPRAEAPVPDDAGQGTGTPDPPESAGSPKPVQLRLFAPHLAVEVDGTDVAERMRSSARMLLALLAIRPDGVSAEEVDDILAPRSGAARTRSHRSNALSSARTVVRTALGDDKVAVVEYDSAQSRYRLQEELFDVDLWRFNDALEKAAGARDPQVGNECRASAVGEYEGELLSAIAETWVETERHRCARDAAKVLVRLAEVAQEGGSANYLRRACEIDRYNEAVYRKLMEAQAALGENDAVHHTYRILVDRLREIGERPSKNCRGFVESLTSITPISAAGPRKPA